MRDDLLVYRNETSGLWTVRRGTDEWRAWAYWLGAEFGRKFFGNDWLTVWDQWPPLSQGRADAIATVIREMRKEIGKAGTSGFRSQTPEHPRPWDGHIPKQIGYEQQP